MIGQRTYTEAEIDAIRAVYDAALVDLDDATADLFEALRARGELDRTVVIVLSDHGEHLGEHGRFEHRWSLHEPLTHVPLVIRYPARFPAQRVADRVSTADVFSTVLEVVGIEAPEGTQTRSLLADPAPNVFAQLLDPYASQLANVREAYAEVEIDYAPLLRTWCAAYEGDDKYLRASDGFEGLYDLARDPGELENRLPAEAPRAQALARALYDWEHGLPDYDPTLRRPIDRRSRAHKQDRAEIRQLELLGYVMSDGSDQDEDVGTDANHVMRCGPPTRPPDPATQEGAP